MRLGRLWIALVACLVVCCGVARADGIDPDIQLGGDPSSIPLIKILTFPSFTFAITFPTGCTLGGSCVVKDDFVNDSGHIITSLVIEGSDLGCGSGPLVGSPFANCLVLGGGSALEFSGAGPGFPGFIAVCTDTDHDGDSGANCNGDDGTGTFSMTFTGFATGTHDFSAVSNVPEPASFGLLFSGLGALIAGYKKFGSRRAS